MYTRADPVARLDNNSHVLLAMSELNRSLVLGFSILDICTEVLVLPFDIVLQLFICSLLVLFICSLLVLIL